MRATLVGVDVGGTFTDLVLVDPRSGARYHHKIASSRPNPAEAALRGFRELLRGAGVRAGEVSSLSHGTTVATNAVIERAYAPTAMVTTAGFRDVLELARQRRPHLWDLDVEKPDSIVPREHRFELRERIDPRGVVVESPDRAEIARSVAAVRQSGAAAVAVCLLHAYANSAHERAVTDALETACPDLRWCRSSDVVGEFREYERFCSTVLNACLLPVMERYLEDLERGAQALGAAGTLRVMQSNGGITSARGARERPIGTFLSGPAAGVVGAAAVAGEQGITDFITFDMGGTSTDVCLVEGGRVPVRREQTVAGLPLRTPTVDIHTVGAGGGSIGWIDRGGLLKVGPRSAGSSPGPACYGAGGTEPTVTDANLLLGRLNQRHLLGGRMPVERDTAASALASRVAQPLGFSLERAAAGLVRIVNANMVEAIRVVSVERGFDPRDFALVAFGGAGPLHAAEVARELAIARVVIPPRPGLLCALGLLQSARRADFSRTRLIRLDDPDAAARLDGLLSELSAEVDEWRAAEGLGARALHREHLLDARYVGQDFELQVAVPTPASSPSRPLDLTEAFHRTHREFYGYASEGHPVEVVAGRIVATRPRPTLPAEEPPAAAGTPVTEERAVWFEETGPIGAPVYLRERLCAGETFAGPAVVEQMDASTLIPPGMSARVASSGALLLEWA